MANYEAQHFVDITIDLDGNRYVRCTFTNCTLQYRGGAPVELTNCEYTKPTLRFLDAAANTAAVLMGLRNTGLREQVDQILGLNRSSS